MFASKDGRLQIVKTLIAAGADKGATNTVGYAVDDDDWRGGEARDEEAHVDDWH